MLYVTPQTQKGPKRERRTIRSKNVGVSPQHMIRINNHTKISTIYVRALRDIYKQYKLQIMSPNIHGIPKLQMGQRKTTILPRIGNFNDRI